MYLEANPIPYLEITSIKRRTIIQKPHTSQITQETTTLIVRDNDVFSLRRCQEFYIYYSLSSKVLILSLQLCACISIDEATAMQSSNTCTNTARQKKTGRLQWVFQTQPNPSGDTFGVRLARIPPRKACVELNGIAMTWREHSSYPRVPRSSNGAGRVW